MNYITLFAWIVVALSVIKMLVLLVNANAWRSFVKRLYSKPTITKLIALILAAVVLYYLINAGITIVEIFAVMLFVMLFLVVGVGSYVKKIVKGISFKQILKEQWFYVLLWLALLVWVVVELI
jgi:hypothetical protein